MGRTRVAGDENLERPTDVNAPAGTRGCKFLNFVRCVTLPHRQGGTSTLEQPPTRFGNRYKLRNRHALPASRPFFRNRRKKWAEWADRIRVNSRESVPTHQIFGSR